MKIFRNFCVNFYEFEKLKDKWLEIYLKRLEILRNRWLSDAKHRIETTVVQNIGGFDMALRAYSTTEAIYYL